MAVDIAQVAHDVLADVGLPRSGCEDDGFRRLAEIVEVEIEYLSYGRLARGSVAVMAGDGGMGKSTVSQDFATSVTRGHALPSGTPGQPRSVVILTAEEDPRAVVRPRMRLMGADLERVFVHTAEEIALTLPSGGPLLADRCRQEEAGLVIIDTGPAFLDRGLKSNNEEDVRAFMAPLRALAEEQRLVVLVLAHLNKDTSRDSRRRIMGGSAWVNAPRQVLLVGAPPGADPRDTGERLLVVEKNNLGAYPPALSFALTPAAEDPSRAVVRWGAEVAGVSSADLVGQPPDAQERSERDAARDFIRAELDDGPLSVKDLKKAAERAGVSWRTVERAKTDLGVRAQKERGLNGIWRWHLPAVEEGAR